MEDREVIDVVSSAIARYLENDKVVEGRGNEIIGVVDDSGPVDS